MKFILKAARTPGDETVYVSIFLDADAKKDLLGIEKKFLAYNEAEGNTVHSVKYWGSGPGLIAFLENFEPHDELRSDQRVHLENNGWVRLADDYTLTEAHVLTFANYFVIDTRFVCWSAFPRGTNTTIDTEGAPWEMFRCPIHGEDDSLEATCLHCLAMSY